jgi:hypothetical protein
MEAVLADWRASTTPVQGVPLASLGGSARLGDDEAPQPRVTVEERYVAPLDFESASQGRGTYFYTVTAFGTGQAGQSKPIVQTTLARVFAW